MCSQYLFFTHFAMRHYMLEDICLETGNHCNAVRLHNTFKSVSTTKSCNFRMSSQGSQSLAHAALHSALHRQISCPAVATVLEAAAGSHFQHEQSTSYWFILRKSKRARATLTLLPSSLRLPPCGSSRRSLGAASPAMTGRTGPSELRHLGAPSLARWMAGSDQSDEEPLHQERRL